MPSSTLVTQLFSSLMRVYRTFPPVGPACGCNHEAHPDNMSCFGTILISYEADGRNRCEGRGSSILTSFGENWLFDGWNVNEFK
jgi:hypothetical protein